MTSRAGPSFLFLCGTAALVGLAALASGSEPSKEPEAALDPQETGRRYTADFYEGRLDPLWERFSDTMKTALDSVSKLKGFRAQLEQQFGTETAVLSENVSESAGLHVYVRQVRYGSSLQRMEVSWMFDDRGVVESFYIRPVAEPAAVEVDYTTRTDLRLPFDGVWHVFWGGRTAAENYHVVNVGQRFAYDFLVFERGSSHSGEGATNGEYHAFARPIVSPGAGKVVVAVDGIPDNVPGVMNPGQPLGNHVVIDHGNGEFSFLAHFERGSVKVKVSEAVVPGSPLGSCGNSGNSSEPHLHYHLQTTSVFDGGVGLPAQFQHYRASGAVVERGEPTKNQTIENRTPEAK